MQDDLHYQARYWKPGPEPGTVRCVLCPRECLLRENQTGFCFVRKNVGGKLELTTYGRSSGFCIDPVEKKPLNHFYPGSSILSFGTAGCNLGCVFCQNWDISRCREFDRLCQQAMPAQIAAAAKANGCKSVAYTYNDPVIFAEYAIDTARECTKLGIKNVAVTAGYIQGAAREDFFGCMDAANVDLKAFSEDFYQKMTGVRLALVLETLVYIKKHTNVWLELTTLLIPGQNDSDAEIRAMAKWVESELGPDVPMHFTAFYPSFKYFGTGPTPSSTLSRARQHALDCGIKYVYTGNVADVEGQSTYCGKCGKMVVERDGFVLGAYDLNGSKCRFCGAECAGFFDRNPGDWGAKRRALEF